MRPTSARREAIAAITAALLALPQSFALATLAGLPPLAGIYTAVFPVMVGALLGSARQALSGPNTALSLVIGVSLPALAVPGTTSYVVLAALLAVLVGILQLAAGALRLGTLFNYLPGSVVAGLTMGTGVLIVLQQIAPLLGIAPVPDRDAIALVAVSAADIGQARPAALAAGLFALLLGLACRRCRPRAPALLVALVGGWAAAEAGLFLWGDPGIERLGRMAIDPLPFAWPLPRPALEDWQWQRLIELALSLSFLALMQSAVIARAVGRETGSPVDIDREFLAQGGANVCGGLLSGFPSCHSFNRSLAHVASGAATRWSGVGSALALLALCWLAADLLATLPMPTLAATLALVGMQMIKPAEARAYFRGHGPATWRTRLLSDGSLFAVTAVATVVSGLEAGAACGLVLAVASYLGQTSKLAMEAGEPAESRHLHLRGNLFFGSVPKLEAKFAEMGRDDGRQGRLVVTLDKVTYVDRCGITALWQELCKREQAGGELVVVSRWEPAPRTPGDTSEA